MAERPSYDLKMDRAEKHLIDLERDLGTYLKSHPYGVREGPESKRKPKVRRLDFTAQPDPILSTVLGDFLYNVRSALDHVQGALVPRKRRNHVMFPIFWQGVWEPGIKGEDRERTKQRERWQTYVRGVAPEALAILKANQPPDVGPHELNTQGLAMLNRLRNADAHGDLPVVATMLTDPIRITYRAPDGLVYQNESADLGWGEGISDDTELKGIPFSAVDVKIDGTPHVIIRVAQVQGGYRIAALREILLDDTRRLIELLRPFVRT
jgi:hypothetical protein